MEKTGKKGPFAQVYEEGPFAQLYTWLVFAAISLLSWDASLTTVVKRLQSDLLLAETNRTSLRRGYFIALVAYTIVVTWLSVAFFALVIYLVCALACMTAGLSTEYWEWIMRKLARPNVVLHCISISHTGFHATVIAGILVSAALSIGFYVTDEDLLHRQYVYSKMIRVLFATPGCFVGAYLIYAVFCICCTISLE